MRQTWVVRGDRDVPRSLKVGVGGEQPVGPLAIGMAHRVGEWCWDQGMAEMERPGGI